MLELLTGTICEVHFRWDNVHARFHEDPFRH
jgi:hypothetical protein